MAKRKSGLRRFQWIDDWVSARSAKRRERDLREHFSPLIDKAAKEKNWNERDVIVSDLLNELDLVRDPILARSGEKLVAKAERYGITVPARPFEPSEENRDWETTRTTGDWIPTKELEARLRHDITQAQRAKHDEIRKWAAFAFGFLGFALAFYSLYTPRVVTRPFIAVTVAPGRDDTNLNEHFSSLELRGAGATAAMNVTVQVVCTYDTHRHWDADYEKTVINAAIKKGDFQTLDHNDLILPGMSKTLQCSASPPPRAPGPIGRATYNRFVHGFVTYRDVWNNSHTTEFCYFHPPTSLTDSLYLCPTLNDAD